MANVTITDLPVLTVMTDADVIPVVNVGTDTTQQISGADLKTYFTGNVTFDDVTVQGVNQLNLSAGPDYTANLAYLTVRAGDYPTHIHLDTGNNAYYDQYFGDDGKYIKLEGGASSNIIIGTDGNAWNWTFDNTGNLNLPTNGSLNLYGGGIRQASDQDLLITTVDNNGVTSSSLEMSPGDTLTRLVQWSSQDSNSWTTSDWDTGVYTIEGGLGAVQFTGAAAIVDFVDSLNGVGQIYFSVNDGPQLVWDGTSSGATNITFYTPTVPDSDPTTITTFEYFYSYESGFEIDYESAEVNIYANNADINLETTNQNDIDLSSARDLTMSGNGIVALSNSSNTDGVVINTDTNGTIRQWNFDVSGNLNTPQGGYIGAAGIKGDGTMLTGGLGNIASLTSFYSDAPGIYASCFTANPDGNLNITTYGNGTGQLGQWTFSGTDLSAPGNISSNAVVVNGTAGDITMTGGNINGANVITANNITASNTANISNVTVNSYSFVPQTWFKGELSAAQNVTTNTDTVTVWNNNTDPLSWGNVTTGNIVPDKAGWYEITSRVQFDINAAANSQNQINTQIHVNTTQVAISQLPNLTADVPVTMICTAMANLNGTTDAITTTCWSNIAGDAQQINAGNASMVLVKWVST